MKKQIRKPAANNCNLQELTWEQMRPLIQRVNPEFVKLVDPLNPDKKHTALLVDYSYGSQVLIDSVLQLPNAKGELVSITDSCIDNKTRERYGYNVNSNPAMMAIEHSLELFLPFKDRIISLYGSISPGNLFGYWRLIHRGKFSHHPVLTWGMSAGSRSIFMLPKISDTESHARLQKEFGISAEAPKKLIHHWQVFTELASHSAFPTPWKTQVLYFSKEWFEHVNDSAWTTFNNFLLITSWKNNDFWRNNYFWNLIFSIIHETHENKPSPFLVDHVKQAFSIGVGGAPGFAPSLNDNSAPITSLQKIYQEIYRLEYPPVILEPTFFNLFDEKPRPVYYSFAFPNASEFSPRTQQKISVITLLCRLESLLNRFCRELATGKFNISDTYLQKVIDTVEFTCFQHVNKKNGGIQDSNIIPLEDPTFLQTANGTIYKEFPATAPFVTGCIRIRRKS